MFKTMLWTLILGVGILFGLQVFSVFYNHVKIQNTFDGISANLTQSSEEEIRQKLKSLMIIQQVDFKVLPDTFFQNLNISKHGSKVSISSFYSVDVWVFGKPDIQVPNPNAEVEDAEYIQNDISILDKIRLAAVVSFSFSPSAKTP